MDRVATDFAQDPEKTISLSTDDVRTIAAFEKYQARKFGRSFAKDNLRSGDPALADTFIRGKYDGVMFNVSGYGTALGGDVNYIGVGVFAAHHGLSNYQLNYSVANYNLAQLGAGQGWYVSVTKSARCARRAGSAVMCSMHIAMTGG